MSQSSKVILEIGQLISSNPLEIDSLNTDVISEKTADSGVTIDGVQLKDSTVNISGIQVVNVQQSAVDDSPGGIYSPLVTVPFVDGESSLDRTNKLNSNMNLIATNIMTLNTDVQNVISQLNDLLSALRAHGLIDT